jgi:hypothetical protein
MLCYAIPRYATLFTLCHAIPLYATLCHDMSRYATLCHDVPRYATLYHAMPRYAYCNKDILRILKTLFTIINYQFSTNIYIFSFEV